MTQDEDNLRLLAIFHYVVGGMTAFFACFPAVYLVFGILMIWAPEKFHDAKGNELPPPEILGWLVAAFGIALILAGWAMAVAIIFAGRSISQRTRYTFCLIVAGIECAFMPFGTVLGVFTLIVLTKSNVKQLFFPKDIFLPANPAGT